MPSIYRPNAAVIIWDGNDRVLLCERADQPGAVQNVQGGIDPGETPLEAARRELWEEVGLSEGTYEIVASLPDPIRYDWPEEVRARVAANTPESAHFIGQEQWFFLARVRPDATFDLALHIQEFSRVAWGSPRELVDNAWSYKRESHRQALLRFGLLNRPVAK